MKLYKHKNNTDVAVEVLSWYQPKGKDYAKIKVRWWNISLYPNRDPYCIWYTQNLTHTDSNSMKDRRKYPLSKWKKEWDEILID